MPDVDGALRTDRLKEYREAHGWSQRELSRRCNLAENMIGKYESRLAEPTASNLKVICDILEISIDYLLGVTDQPNRVITQSDLDEEENKIIRTYRRQGWPGVIQLGGQRLSE